MVEVAFAPGAVCGSSLTQAQVQDRQHACTRCAEDEMPDPKSYRLWKAKMVQQAQSSSTAPNRAWKGFLWTLLIVLTLAALLFGAGASQFSTGTSFQISVSNAWRTHFPHTQLSALSNRLPAFYSVTQPKAAASVSSSLFPEIKHNVEAQAGAAPETADQGVSASLLKDAEQLVPASSKLFPEIKHNIHALSQADISENLQQPADSGLTLSLLNSAKKLVPASDALFPEIKHNAASQHDFAEQVEDMQQHLDKLKRQTERQQQELTQAEQTIMTLSSSKAAVETRLRGSQQKAAGLQADLARAECLLDSHAVAKMKLPLFPMSPLAAPPVKHNKDKENSGRPAKTARSQAAAQQEGKPTSPEQPEKEALLDRLKHMEAEKATLEDQVATLQAEQVGLKDACRKADEQRSKMQLDTEALELRVFTTHEQLAVSEEREAELAAAVQEAKQSAAAARQALATNQQAVKPPPSPVLQDEQEQEDSSSRQNNQPASGSGSDSIEQQECSVIPSNSHTGPATDAVGTAEPATEAQLSPIYGVATASSQAFTPTQRNRPAQNSKQGPKTPWSADWVTSFFGSSGAKSSASRRAGSISPTRLFEFNGDNTVPEPEDLFRCWHGKLTGLGSPSRT
ncbi:hypothetical protein WJX82_004318 [Trebouxia sp. C0006]